MIHITHDGARTILDALDAAEENVQLDRLNDDEGVFRDLEIQIGAARDFLAALMGENGRDA